MLFQFDDRSIRLWAVLAMAVSYLAGILVALWRLFVEGSVSGALWAFFLGVIAAEFLRPRGF
jgi:hypothetical protein